MRFVRGRRSRRLGLVTAPIAVILSLVFAASAAAEARSGSATDGTEPERIPGSIDITAVSASYDTNGSVNVAVTTLAPPPKTEEVVLTARLGVLSGNECAEPLMAIVGTYTQPPAVAWGTTFGSEGEGSESVSGTTTTLAAADPALAGQPFNCVEPAIYEVDEEGELLEPALEGLIAPIQLVGPPPPPAPAPPPAPTPPPAPVPASTPKANLTFPSKTVTVHRNAWKKVTVKITNIGDTAAGKVALKVGKAKGVATRPRSGKLKLRSIAAGKSKVASFRVRLSKKAKARSKLTLALAGAKGLKASGVLTLEAWKKPRSKKGRKGKQPPVPATPPLAEKIFYAYRTETSHSATLIGYAFIDGEWAYHGIPTEGLPSCTEVTGNAEKEGCLKYRYDPRSGSVQIGSLAGKIASGGQLEVDGETYSATAIPAAGTRLQVEQEFIGYSGLCGLISGCTTWHEHLMLNGNGEFVLSRESLTTIGGSGPGETFVAAGSYPPDQHGTYAIEPKARLHLSYADGTTRNVTIAVFLNKEGKPDPVGEGLLVGDDYFTFAHTE